MANFDEAVSLVIIHEGGLSNDSADPGGLTKFGISKKTHAELDIASLTIEQAKDIYRKEYWDPFGFEKISSQAIANRVFDIGVNAGCVMSIRILQQSLSQFVVGPIVADGKIGPLTIAAIDSVDESKLLQEFRARACYFHAGLCIENPDRKRFLLGWLRRDIS